MFVQEKNLEDNIESMDVVYITCQALGGVVIQKSNESGYHKASICHQVNDGYLEQLKTVIILFLEYKKANSVLLYS